MKRSILLLCALASLLLGARRITLPVWQIAPVPSQVDKFVAYYDFEDPGNLGLNKSIRCGNDCNLTKVGTVTSGSGMAGRGGTLGYSIQGASGARNVLTCTNSVCDELDPPVNGAWSFGCAIYPTDSPATPFRFVDNQVVGEAGGYAFSSGGAALRAVVGPSGGAISVDTPVVPPLSAWSPVAMTWNSSDKKERTYVDGVLAVTSAAQATGAAPGTRDFDIGNPFTSSQNALNYLDQCWFIDRALRADEICFICSCGPGNESGCTYSTADSKWVNLGRNTYCGDCAMPPDPANPIVAAPTIKCPSQINDVMAYWNFDDPNNLGKNLSVRCGRDCDLYASGTVTQSTTTVFAGKGSMRPSNAASRNVMWCADATCDELDVKTNGSFTFGYSMNMVAGGFSRVLENYIYLSNNGGYGSTPSSTVLRQAGNMGPTYGDIGMDSNVTWTLGTWGVIGGSFSNTDKIWRNYFNGINVGSTAAGGGPILPDPYDWAIGNTAVSGLVTDAYIDSAFYSDRQLTPAEMCYVCSCGIDNEFGCSYITATGMISGTGRNASCGNCTLPADGSDPIANPDILIANSVDKFTAYWNFEDPNNLGTNLSPNCPDCTLTLAGTVTAYSTPPIWQGQYAINPAQGARNALFCVDSVCDELDNLNWGFGCAVYPTAALTSTSTNFVDNLQSIVGGFTWGYKSTGIQSLIATPSNSSNFTMLAPTVLGVNAWSLLGMNWRNSDKNEWIYLNGAFNNNANANTTTGAGLGNHDFELGNPFTGSTNGPIGLLDACWYRNYPIDVDNNCTICSCGVMNEFGCTYDQTSGAWSNKGKNATACGSCTLPANPRNAIRSL